MAKAAAADTAALRRLLMLARDLLQAPDRASVLALAGQAIPELLLADGALLLVVIGEHEHLVEVDRRGSIVPARGDSVLLRHARQAMAARAPLLLPEIAADVIHGPAGIGRGPREPVHAHDEAASLVAFPFPPIQPLGTLAAFWSHCRHPDELAGQLWLLRHLGELTAAALGNAGFRQSLQGQVAAQSREMATAASEHAGELLRRDDVEDEIRQVAVTDVLTGMLNRRGFFLRAEQSFKVARRLGLPSALLFVDIDGLKAVNDKFGHDAGDRLIEDAARILRQSFRDSDVVARLGGDEFAAFTLDSAQPQAILARIQHNIESWAMPATSPVRVSFSTGIVQCDPASGLTLSDYLALADGQMYAQKKRSREAIPPPAA